MLGQYTSCQSRVFTDGYIKQWLERQWAAPCVFYKHGRERIEDGRPIHGEIRNVRRVSWLEHAA